ncbi:MAG: hypothetical protein GTO60_04825, partial [Gammaproteobacteria bacterium]|nr:hypothetical protein [Gammaproteobacteria bacterium]
MTTSAPFCTDGTRIRATNNAPQDMLLMIKSTSYSQAMDVTGVNTRWYLEDKDGGGKTFRFYLGYVPASGNFTSQGYVDYSIGDGQKNTYTIDLSSISFTAPSGSYLAMKMVKQSGNNEGRLEFSSSTSSRVTVDEVACTPTTGPLQITDIITKNGDPIEVCSDVTTNGASNVMYKITEGGGACDMNTTGEYYIDIMNYNTFGDNWSDSGTYLTAAVSNTGAPGGNPLEFTVNFTQTGTYRIWFRGNATDSGSNSLWYGLDGSMVGNAGWGTYGSWLWENNWWDTGPDPIEITISSTGNHTMNVWAREANLQLDGFIITADTGFTPSGAADGGASNTVDPTNCGTVRYGPNAVCSGIDTTGWTDGATFTLDVTGDDDCGDPLTPATDDFIWNANSAPTLNIDQPNGTGDTVTVGDNYSIQYDLSDSDDTVTAAFYYDTNNSGLDGTAISGACATAAEGTNATCTWDTTGMTPGNYYVYGITDDGTNPQVSDYSSGQITINAPTENRTTISGSSATPDNQQITVSSPYTNDTNGNNGVTIGYRTSGGGAFTTFCDLSASHQASPYTCNITGLTNGQAYDVQIDWNDADGFTNPGSDPEVLTNITPLLWSDNSMLLHNANRFGDCSDNDYDGTSQSDCEGAGGTWTPTSKWSA